MDGENAVRGLRSSSTVMRDGNQSVERMVRPRHKFEHPASIQRLPFSQLSHLSDLGNREKMPVLRKLFVEAQSVLEQPPSDNTEALDQSADMTFTQVVVPATAETTLSPGDHDDHDASLDMSMTKRLVLPLGDDRTQDFVVFQNDDQIIFEPVSEDLAGLSQSETQSSIDMSMTVMHPAVTASDRDGNQSVDMSMTCAQIPLPFVPASSRRLFPSPVAVVSHAESPAPAPACPSSLARRKSAGFQPLEQSLDMSMTNLISLGAPLCAETPTSPTAAAPAADPLTDDVFSVAGCEEATADASLDMSMTTMIPLGRTGFMEHESPAPQTDAPETSEASLDMSMTNMIHLPQTDGEEPASPSAESATTLEASLDMSMTKMIPQTIEQTPSPPDLEASVDMSMTNAIGLIGARSSMDPHSASIIPDELLDMSMTNMVSLAPSQITTGQGHSEPPSPSSPPLVTGFDSYSGAESDMSMTTNVSQCLRALQDDEWSEQLNESQTVPLADDILPAERAAGQSAAYQFDSFSTRVDGAGSSGLPSSTEQPADPVHPIDGSLVAELSLLQNLQSLAGFRVPVRFPDDPVKQHLLEKAVLTPLMLRLRGLLSKANQSRRQVRQQLETLPAATPAAAAVDSQSQQQERGYRQFLTHFQRKCEDFAQQQQTSAAPTEQSFFLERDCSELQARIRRIQECDSELTMDLEKYQSKSRLSLMRSTVSPQPARTLLAGTSERATDLASIVDGLAEEYEQLSRLHPWRLSCIAAGQMTFSFDSLVRNYDLCLETSGHLRLAISEPKVDNVWWDALLPGEVLQLIVDSWNDAAEIPPALRLRGVLRDISLALLKAEQSLQVCCPSLRSH